MSGATVAAKSPSSRLIPLKTLYLGAPAVAWSPGRDVVAPRVREGVIGDAHGDGTRHDARTIAFIHPKRVAEGALPRPRLHPVIMRLEHVAHSVPQPAAHPPPLTLISDPG